MDDHPQEQGALGDEDYRTLAAFRHAIRRFLAFSENAARSSGLAPRQHQAILAIRSRSPEPMSIGDLAERLLVRHHTAVELVDRLVKAGLARRLEADDDRRRVVVSLTPRAEALLRDLSAAHLAELARLRPLLAGLLQRLEEH
jgi:DNA-binding MarR family transcriptional regulator